MAIWESVVLTFGKAGWFWLISFLALSCYSVLYLYCYLVLLSSSEDYMFDFSPLPVYTNRGLGIFLLSFFGFLKFNWVGSWVMGLIITHFMDRDYMPHTKSKLIMQASRGFAPGQTARWEPNDRPKICPRCERRCPDRVYHDNTTGRCLPIFDHYCPWVHISVYSRTMKAYLYFLLFLLFDIFATLCVLIKACTSTTGQSIWPFVVTGALALVSLLVGDFMWGPTQWKHLAFNNEVHFEHRQPKQPKLFAFRVTQGGRDLIYFDNFYGNPWDRGYMDNLRQVLGSSWWMWLMFWWQPERVARYGRYEPNIDLPYSDKIWAKRHEVMASLSERRRVAQFWSGSTAPPLRPRRVQLRSAEQTSSIHGEESSEPRRRMSRTS